MWKIKLYGHADIDLRQSGDILELFASFRPDLFSFDNGKAVQ